MRVAHEASVLHAQALKAWQHWDALALDQACDAAGEGDAAEVAYWRALACLMREGAQALSYLELAYQQHLSSGNATRAISDAQLALSICVLDVGAMDQVERWLARVNDPAAAEPAMGLDEFWRRLSMLAQVVYGASDAGTAAAAAAAAAQLQEQLAPLRHDLLPNERLMAAQMLVNYHFHQQRYERFDWLAAVVEEPALFDRAAPLMQSRWFYTLGFALYQEGEHGRAEDAWRRAFAIAETHALDSARLMTGLALIRLLIDAQRAEEADRMLQAVQPRWGAGRTTQLIELQQMRARVQLLRHQPARAHATLNEALALAETSKLSASEMASCLTDLSQVLIALERNDEAQSLLQRLSDEHQARNGEVFACLRDLLSSLCLQYDDPVESQRCLAEGLARAQRIRYTMFFRLLPAVAARVCALALQSSIEPVFAVEVVRARSLPAPEGAGLTWPWPLWVRMIGAFELQGLQDAVPAGVKTQQKPLELLRLMACQRGLSIGIQEVMDALWPEAEGDGARKSLDMAVQRLRRLLGDSTLVSMGDGRLALDTKRVASDVAQRRLLIEQLDALAMAPARTSSANTSARCAEIVTRTVSLTRGELLPGASLAPWLQAERRRFQQETVRAAMAAAAVMEHAGSRGEEVALLETALAIEPLSELLGRRLMATYARNAQMADVGRVYAALQRALALQGLPLAAETQSLWQRLIG